MMHPTLEQGCTWPNCQCSGVYNCKLGKPPEIERLNNLITEHTQLNSEWQDFPPNRPGVWLLSCMETDDRIDPVNVYFKDGILWANDPLLHPMPLIHLHEGLTSVLWRFNSGLDEAALRKYGLVNEMRG